MKLVSPYTISMLAMSLAMHSRKTDTKVSTKGVILEEAVESFAGRLESSSYGIRLVYLCSFFHPPYLPLKKGIEHWTEKQHKALI